MHRDLCGRLTREIPKTARGMVRGIGARGAHSAPGAVSAVTVRVEGWKARQVAMCLAMCCGGRSRSSLGCWRLSGFRQASYCFRFLELIRLRLQNESVQRRRYGFKCMPLAFIC